MRKQKSIDDLAEKLARILISQIEANKNKNKKDYKKHGQSNRQNNN